MVVQPPDGADSPPPDPVAAYWAALTDLRAAAHNPSWRTLESGTARAGHRIPNSTLQNWFTRRTTIPDRPASDALITALGANPNRLQPLWFGAYNTYRTASRRSPSAVADTGTASPEPDRRRWPIPAAFAVLAITAATLVLTRPSHPPGPTSTASSAKHAGHADFYRAGAYFILYDDARDNHSAILDVDIAGKSLSPAYNPGGVGTNSRIPVPPTEIRPGATIKYRICIGGLKVGTLPNSCGPWTTDHLAN